MAGMSESAQTALGASDHASGFDVVALGEPLVEFSQDADGVGWRQGFGGDTSNFAIAAARAGARSAYLSRVGDEDFGHALLRLWREEKVDCSAVEIDADSPTGIYFIRYDHEGHHFSYRRSGSAATKMTLSPGFVRVIEQGRWLHVSGISQAISEQACDTVFEAIRLARSAGRRVSFDLNFRARLWPVARARTIALETLPLCDLFLPSIDEAQAVFGLEDPVRLATWAREQGARAVAVKCGARGALIADGTEYRAIAAPQVAAIDATGAGDCFGGVLVARLAAGDSLLDAARAATAAASLATTGRGAIEPLPRWPEIAAAIHTIPAGSRP
jgi:2-dehydro-3-deoxygluconokinase